MTQIRCHGERIVSPPIANNTKIISTGTVIQDPFNLSILRVHEKDTSHVCQVVGCKVEEVLHIVLLSYILQ
ncbi:hypothetical protein M758_2G081800 [Ceratodon purpureus]|nr:hypothetical protein M758_2G081800 [Ceratodon purpureus]